MGRLLTYPELDDKKGIHYSRSHLWLLEREGKFPLRVRVGANSIAWDEEEIDAYINAKRAARTVASPPPPRPFRRVKRRA
jgi:predicted DNA-binding transcriptional regulator AlpA